MIWKKKKPLGHSDKKAGLGHTLRGNVHLTNAIERRHRGRPKLGMTSELAKEGYYKMKAMTSNRRLWNAKKAVAV